ALLVLVSMGTGVFLGIGFSAAIAKKKENPFFWKQTVRKQLDKLHPTAEQRKKFEARTESAVQELVTIRKDAVGQVWSVVERAVGDIDKELTAEQRVKLKALKPKKPAELK
ncbi:MAG: hypothetical protein JWO89_3610, partial [Verrucomicrobiaceae bacterium]|nr:hypothetical protein [Verrucomicrobiaceae bacterium]